MMDKTETAILQLAIAEAIEAMGVDAFKRTSFFMSNRKPEEQNKAETATCKPSAKNENCGV